MISSLVRVVTPTVSASLQSSEVVQTPRISTSRPRLRPLRRPPAVCPQHNQRLPRFHTTLWAVPPPRRPLLPATATLSAELLKMAPFTHSIFLFTLLHSSFFLGLCSLHSRFSCDIKMVSIRIQTLAGHKGMRASQSTSYIPSSIFFIHHHLFGSLRIGALCPFFPSFFFFYILDLTLLMPCFNALSATPFDAHSVFTVYLPVCVEAGMLLPQGITIY